MAYRSRRGKIKYRSSRSRKSSYRSKRRRSSSRRKSLLKGRLKKKQKEKLEKIFWTSIGFAGVLAMLGTIIFFIWLKKLTKELPSLKDGPPPTASSVIYDRNGVELYKVSSKDFSRDYLRIDEYTPETLKWTFMAAEDEEFLTHKGVDFSAIIRCALRMASGGDTCGGSTITQQVILNTVISRNERTIKRKLKDIILALQLERIYEKDEIMNSYLNIVPQGGGTLGVKTGAQFYFKKNLEDLSIAEMAVLAAIVQSPSTLSPTVGTDLESNKERLYERTDYLINQMIDNIKRINKKIDEANDKNKEKYGEDYIKQEHITKEELEEAKEEVRNLEFVKPTVDIKAPHFVFYVIKLLQERGYNVDKPFLEEEIQTGGLKIYTTLDYSLQEIAQKYVSSSEPGHAGFYRNKFGGKNSALVTLRPSTGEVLAMVGSKCYQNNEYIQNCEELDVEEGTLFDPDVNILDTLQSPGSTNKAIGYYIGFNEGKISTSSMLPDVPININGYQPKNWNGGFSGMGNVRTVFAMSLNLPALFVLESYGVQKYIDTARAFGYTSYGDTQGYGPSVILGGCDVKPIEHAQGFGVFANGGDFVQHEVIKKITDIDGNVLFEYEPKKENIANPAAIYLVNNVLSRKGSGSIAPPKHMTDRDVAGKTGTSESNRDTWFVMWSPDFVSLGWMGNNDNTKMDGRAFGSTSVEPWVGTYMDELSGAFPDKTPFTRPSGIISTAGECKEEDQCLGQVGLAVAGKAPSVYLQKKTFTVCVDQPNKLARDIDIVAGLAVEREFKYLKSVAPHLQKFVDKYFLGQEAEEGGLPTEQCDIPRPYDLSTPEGIIISPKPGQAYEGSMNIDARAFVGNEKFISKIEFYVGNKLVASTNDASYSGTVNLDGVPKGLQNFKMVMYDSENKEGTRGINVYIGKLDSYKGTLSLSTSPQVDLNTSTPVSVTYEGSRNLESIALYQTNQTTNVTSLVSNMRKVSKNTYEYNWKAPGFGEYNLYAVAEGFQFTLPSNAVTIKVADPNAAESDESE
ncbi:hypothetical protein GF362_05110 [Candidatus Dojkabacteria bacterium]|nr:hypothetical protein [Candidatus Dojkabacteria bacterium]